MSNIWQRKRLQFLKQLQVIFVRMREWFDLLTFFFSIFCRMCSFTFLPSQLEQINFLPFFPAFPSLKFSSFLHQSSTPDLFSITIENCRVPNGRYFLLAQWKLTKQIVFPNFNFWLHLNKDSTKILQLQLFLIRTIIDLL